VRTLRQALAVTGLGAILSALALVAGGRTAPAYRIELLVALEAQVPVHLWDEGDLGDDVLVVDGRDEAAFGARHPAGALHLPFEERHETDVTPPADRPVRAAVVVMERGRALQARALAQWLAREWALPAVGTFRGGFEAWREKGLPCVER
jgi:rhodanese-related sulfurtransferase